VAIATAGCRTPWVTRPAVRGRIHHGTLPAEETGCPFRVRRDLLEQVEAARQVRKARLSELSDSSYEATSGSNRCRDPLTLLVMELVTATDRSHRPRHRRTADTHEQGDTELHE
jgi:hypothetical protein